MSASPYRPLLPAPSAQSPLDSSAARSEPTKRKRDRVRTSRVACNACRLRKSACDGARPSCSRCQVRGERCQYVSQDENESMGMVRQRETNALKDRVHALEELIGHLKHMPEDMAQVILSRLRTASDPASVLASLSGDSRYAQLSEQATDSSLPSPPESQSDFGLPPWYSASYLINNGTVDEMLSGRLAYAPTTMPDGNNIDYSAIFEGDFLRRTSSHQTNGSHQGPAAGGGYMQNSASEPYFGLACANGAYLQTGPGPPAG